MHTIILMCHALSQQTDELRADYLDFEYELLCFLQWHECEKTNICTYKSIGRKSEFRFRTYLYM